jgi:hypothetical protein
MITFKTRVQGIPCVCQVNSFDRGEPVFLGHTPDGAEEAVGAEMDLTVCDRRGRPAPWLEAKMKEKDWFELVSEAGVAIEAEERALAVPGDDWDY